MSVKIDKKMVLVISGVVLVSLLGWVVFSLCSPMVSEINRLHAEEAAYAAEVFNAKELLIKKNTGGVVAQLIPKNQVSSVVNEIKKVAGKYNVTLTLVRPAFVGPAMEGVSNKVFFEMKAVSSLKDLGFFMTAVRNMPGGLVAIEEFRVQPSEAKAEQVNTKITFILLVAKDDAKK